MESMYLVDKKMSLIGACVYGVDGWRFLPNVTSRGPSKKSWCSAVACIPKWAFDISDDLLTLDEWMKSK